MNENAQGTESLEMVRRPLKFRRFSAVGLLIALALLFFFFPFVEEVKGGDLIVSLLLSLVLLSVVLAIPAIAGRWINHFWPDVVRPAVFLTAALLLTAFVVVNLLRFVLRAPS